MRKMTKLEKDFRGYISAAINDETPLPDKYSWKSSINTYGDMNKRYIECYERGLITMREVIARIDRNVLESARVRFEEKGAEK